jgi:hypothetical protein
VFILVTKVILSKLAGRMYPWSFTRSAMVGAQSGMPWSEPGMPMVSSPVLNGCMTK